MKNLLKTCLLSLLFLATFTANGQQVFAWDHYNISFTLANDFRVVTNTADEFTADGDGMSFAIFPFNDASIDNSDIATYTADIATSINLEQVDDADVIKLNGLEGAYVEGYKDGARVVMLGFIDPVSETNFFALITFADNDQEAENEAVRMIKSFKKK